MFNPEVMKMAMDQMGRMTPDQLAAMQRQMGNISPDMLQQSMQAMNHMSPDDLRRAEEQMRTMSPADLQAASGQYANYMSGQQQYKYNAAMQLKTEGNKLHSAGKYAEAAEKYERAQANLEGHTQKAAGDLRQACRLNLASCYLNLHQYDQCISHCNNVLQADASNRKALYRRGQAYLQKNSNKQAVADLERALCLSPDSEKEVIKEKLELAKTRLSAAQEDGAIQDAEVEVEEVVEAQVSSSASTRPTPPAAPTPLNMPFSPEQAAQFSNALKENPDLIKQSAEMLTKMDPAALQAAAAAQGLPLDPEMACMSLEALANTSPEELQRMAEMSAAMSSATRGPGATVVEENVTSRNQRRSSITESTAPASVPDMGGLNLTPDMMKMATDMMSKMSLEDMARLATLAQPEASGASGGLPAGGGAPSMGDMMQQLSDPEMMKTMQRMLGSMEPEALAGMMSQTGMKVTPDQAKQFQDMANKLTPGQLQMLAKTTSFFAMLKQVWARWWMLIVSLLVLLLALLCRYLGWF